MSAPPPTTSEHQPSLEHLLLRFGLVTLDQMSLALREQTEIGTPFTESLVRDGVVSAEDLARVADRAPSAAPQAPAAEAHDAAFAPPPVFEGAPPPEPFAPEAPSEQTFAEPPLSESAPEPPYERPTVRFTTHPPAGAYDPAAEEHTSEPPVSYDRAGFSFDPEPEAAAPEPSAFETPSAEHEPSAFETPAEHAPSEVSFDAEPDAFEADEPEPVAFAPASPAPVPLPPIFSFDPEPAEAAPAAPAPVAEAAPPTFEPPTTVPVPTGFVVRGHLVNGEDVEIATVEDEAEAQRIARDAMRACARADGSDWPVLNGRYVRPDAIVSIEVAERV